MLIPIAAQITDEPYRWFLPFIARPARPQAHIPQLGYMVEGAPDGQTAYMTPKSLVRYRVRWDLIERDPGVYDWSALDRDALLLAQHNAALMFGVIGTPSFYRMIPHAICSPPTQAHIPALERFCVHLARRYNPAAIELWNEPEIRADTAARAGLDHLLGGFGIDLAAHYGVCVRAVGSRLRAENSPTWLVAGSLMLDTPDFWLAARPHCEGQYDALSYHSYTIYPSPYYGDAGDKARLLRQTGEPMPLILSEFALLSDGDGAEFRSAQAAYLRHVIANLPTWDVLSAIWYPLYGNGWMCSDLAAHGRTYPAWEIYAEATR